MFIQSLPEHGRELYKHGCTALITSTDAATPQRLRTSKQTNTGQTGRQQETLDEPSSSVSCSTSPTCLHEDSFPPPSVLSCSIHLLQIRSETICEYRSPFVRTYSSTLHTHQSSVLLTGRFSMLQVTESRAAAGGASIYG